ncbi:MAG: hypothetical protein JWM93_1639, partial [Frankiales bacterium]|nr:hypothetical protein [Frankiales bacterium]
MVVTDFVLVHGAATVPSVYDAVVAALRLAAPGSAVDVPLRPSSGDLATELRALGDV